MLSAKSINGDGGGTVTLVRAAGHTEKPLAQLIVNGLVTITPELARRISLECGYERQRGVRPMHASVMAAAMRKKEWTSGTQLHFARMSDGWLRLLNGQHRLTAVMEANCPVEFQILVTDCKNETEVARLYRRHDRGAAARTIEDMLRAEGLPGKYGLTGYFARGVFNAALIIAAGFAFSHRIAKTDPYLYRSDEARLRLCQPWWQLAEEFSEMINKGDARVKKHLSAGPAMAVALVTLRDQPTKAEPFWRGLANNDGLKRGDPRASYLNYLNVGRAKLGGFAAAKGVSIAWNAFYAGRRLEFIRLTDSPIRIDGCEIEG